MPSSRLMPHVQHEQVSADTPAVVRLYRPAASGQPTVECGMTECHERRDALRHLDESLADHRAGTTARGHPGTDDRELERAEADVPGKLREVATGALRVALEQLRARREAWQS